MNDGTTQVSDGVTRRVTFATWVFQMIFWILVNVLGNLMIFKCPAAASFLFSTLVALPLSCFFSGVVQQLYLDKKHQTILTHKHPTANNNP